VGGVAAGGVRPDRRTASVYFFFFFAAQESAVRGLTYFLHSLGPSAITVEIASLDDAYVRWVPGFQDPLGASDR
jgi:hypothetical protein